MLKLKEQLIKKIQETSDKDILEEVYRLLEIDFEDNETYTLSEEQEIAVNEAQEQIKKGQYLSEKEANHQAEEWLKRK